MKFAKEIWNKLLVSLLSAPIVWAITIYFSKSISGMLSDFSVSWYTHYWYLVFIAVVLAIIQCILLSNGGRTVLIISLLILAGLLGVYAWKQIAERNFPFDWPLWFFFFLYCLAVFQLVSIAVFGIITITRSIWAAADG